MGAIATAFSSTFRDYNTDGVAGSGVKQVVKSDCRSLGATIEAYFAAPFTISANTTAVTSPIAGTTGYIFQLIGDGSAANQHLSVDGYGGIPGIRLRRSNITSAAASAIQSGNVIGTFDVLGYGASAMASGARGQIRMVATQNWTDSANGTKVVIGTTPNGSTTLVDAITINQDQSVSFAGAVSTSGPRYHTNMGMTSVFVSGQTVTLTAGAVYHIASIDNTITSMTISMPSTPSDGQIQYVTVTGSVATVTMSNGTFVNAPTSASAGQVFGFIYNLATSKWYRIA